MVYRALCGALALLVLTVSLGATLCTSCAPGHCALSKAAGPPVPEEHAAESHCHQAGETAGVPATGHGVFSSALSDCCALTAAPEAESSYPAVFPSYELALELIGSTDGPAVRPHDIEARPEPPRLPPRHLYTLHSSLLI